jgi:hypothetical protein
VTGRQLAWICLAALVAAAPAEGPKNPKPAPIPTKKSETTPKKTVETPPELMLEIDSPNNGAVIGDPTGMAFIGGKALALYGEYQTFDIMFVIDTSDSTAEPSGADIDGNGLVGEKRMAKYLGILSSVLPLPNSDKADSVLAAEIAGCRVLLKQLDPRTTRVGIVSFNGDADAMTPDAITEVPRSRWNIDDYSKTDQEQPGSACVYYPWI